MQNIVALAPMDGVTDAAFRAITDRIGHPDILFTEFTSVEGLSRGITALLDAFIYHKTETHTIAQVFGTEPESFYKSAFMIAELGFAGMDINMGCPDRNVAKRGGGAGLIRQPKLAQEIISRSKRAMRDWANGKTMVEADVPAACIAWIKEYTEKNNISVQRRQLPVSVKTRIGYDQIVTHDWISTLLEVEPVIIAVHGRTLKQMYTGLANWDEIGKAAELVRKTNTMIFGNGDIKTRAEALDKIHTYNLNGALIGRASFGNPWVFTGEQVSFDTKLKTALLHAHTFMQLTPQHHFLSLRKHMAWYLKGVDHATDLRVQLMQAKSVADIEATIAAFSAMPPAHHNHG